MCPGSGQDYVRWIGEANATKHGEVAVRKRSDFFGKARHGHRKLSGDSTPQSADQPPAADVRQYFGLAIAHDSHGVLRASPGPARLL
jgi:hypothetical protein